jgi:hypothetical protein
MKHLTNHPASQRYENDNLNSKNNDYENLKRRDEEILNQNRIADRSRKKLKRIASK